MKIVGVDPSLTGTGVAVIRDGRFTGATVIKDSRWKKRAPQTERERQERLDVILCRVSEWAVGADLVVLEGLSFDSHDTMRQLAGLSWLLRRQCWKADRPFVLVPPSTLKLWAVDHGKADKGVMLAAARETFPGVEIEDDNAADAVWLAALGADHLGYPLVDMPERRAQALAKVAWPTPAVAA
jgi:Holliday junction resolvasome RuvABC endonuclease subunit